MYIACTPAYSLYEFMLIAYSVGDTGNLMRAKQISPFLSYGGKGVSDIILIMTYIYIQLQRW